MMVEIEGAIGVDGTAVLICSTSVGYSELARLIRQTGHILMKGECVVFPNKLDEVTVTNKKGGVVVSVQGSGVSIQGPPESRDIVAGNIERFCADARTPSFHIENHPGHFYLDPDSLSIIFSKITGK